MVHPSPNDEPLIPRKAEPVPATRRRPHANGPTQACCIFFEEFPDEAKPYLNGPETGKSASRPSGGGGGGGGGSAPRG
ncbi:hypothetical protein LX36DRAFT_658514 [Colletotrichum falcatum]|nr:hypothetical protein LX36DRAFT_658514 [Colletotrichum falcatum]